jgi:hypothetical protein
MNQESNNQPDPEMLAEYDFSGGSLWEVCRPLSESRNVLDPDVAQVFADSNLSIRRCVL